MKWDIMFSDSRRAARKHSKGAVRQDRVDKTAATGFLPPNQCCSLDPNLGYKMYDLARAQSSVSWNKNLKL